jgi:hypothetical protein
MVWVCILLLETNMGEAGVVLEDERVVLLPNDLDCSVSEASDDSELLMSPAGDPRTR